MKLLLAGTGTEESKSALAAAILRLVNNEEKRIKFGNRSREIVLQKFHLPVI